jgi:hypothetical protein
VNSPEQPLPNQRCPIESIAERIPAGSAIWIAITTDFKMHRVVGRFSKFYNFFVVHRKAKIGIVGFRQVF